MQAINFNDYIFLDDIRTPISTRHVRLPLASWYIVRNYKEFRQAINQYYCKYDDIPPFIAFDHDLNEEHYDPLMLKDPIGYDKLRATFREKTGLDCAKWLIEFCKEKRRKLPDYICHSMNPVGRASICMIMDIAKAEEHLYINKL